MFDIATNKPSLENTKALSLAEKVKLGNESKGKIQRQLAEAYCIDKTTEQNIPKKVFISSRLRKCCSEQEAHLYTFR